MTKQYRVIRTEMERCYGRQILVVDDLSAVQAHAFARGVVHGLTMAGWEREPCSLLVVRDPTDGALWHYDVWDFDPAADGLFSRDAAGYCLDEHGQRVPPAHSPDRDLERRMLAHRLEATAPRTLPNSGDATPATTERSH